MTVMGEPLTANLEPRPGQHDMMIALEGTDSCLEGECYEYYDEHGHELDVGRCSHVSTRPVCADCPDTVDHPCPKGPAG